jgi:hypothetical protein
MRNDAVLRATGDDYDSPISLALFQSLMEGDVGGKRSMTTVTEKTEVFCSGKPRNINAVSRIQIVLETITDDGDIMTLPALQAACEIDEAIRSRGNFNPYYCVTTYNWDTRDTDCCKSRTIPNYVAEHAGKDSCLLINETDITA